MERTCSLDAVAAAGTAGTIAALVARGAGDWASASTSVRLYSFPIVAIAGAVSLLIVDSARPRSAAEAAGGVRQRGE